MDLSILTIGWIASIGTIFMFIPQVVKTMKTKDTSTLSNVTFPLVVISCSLWSIFSALIKSWQSWTCNITTAFLMIPIIYYLFINKKWVFYLLLSIIVLTLPLTIMLFTLDIEKSTLMDYIFLIVAGGLSGFSLYPETIKVVKEKDVGSFSLPTSFAILLFQFFWINYWALSAVEENDTSIRALHILALAFTFMAFASQIPVIYIYYRYPHHKNNL